MHPLLSELTRRGLLQDHTPGLPKRLAAGPITAYVGFDPTAPSLQIGNLVPVMLLAHLQRAGGTPIVLVGGGTGMIGDPSGRSTERPLLDPEVIDANAERQRGQLEQFLDFSPGTNPARVLNNADWLRPLSLVGFLRDIGKHFTISYMLQKESVRSRMDAGISYTEFTYMLLQAYDFLHLHRREGCELQMGGSDQWGNITAGTELIRRADGAEAHGLSAPLVTTATGTKFGKTEGEAVWLDPELTSPYTFYQFWINVDDRDVGRYLRMFTFETPEAIDSLLAEHERAPGARLAQRRLARDLTSRVHGDAAAERVADAARLVFGQSDPTDAPAETWQVLERELPTWRTTSVALPETLVALAAAAGLTRSRGEARRQLQQGGIALNGRKANPETTVGPDDLLAGHYLWLRRGRKTDVIVRVD